MANIGFVARAQEEFGHMASRIDHRVKLGVQTTLRAAHSLMFTASAGVGGATVGFDMGGIQKTFRAHQLRRTRLPEHLPKVFPAPTPIILIDGIPTRPRLINRPPLAPLA